MSDGIKRMYEDEAERQYVTAVDKFKAKDPEEVYLLLKDLQSDIQFIFFDERLSLTRGQWSAITRMHNVMKDLLK